MVTPGGDYSNQRVQLAQGQQDGGTPRDAQVPLHSGAHASSHHQLLQMRAEIPLPSLTLSALAPAHGHFFFPFFFLVPCVTNFTHFLSLSRIVKDLIRVFPVLIVIRTVIVRAIKGNWATAEWKSP